LIYRFALAGQRETINQLPLTVHHAPLTPPTIPTRGRISHSISPPCQESLPAGAIGGVMPISTRRWIEKCATRNLWKTFPKLPKPSLGCGLVIDGPEAGITMGEQSWYQFGFS